MLIVECRRSTPLSLPPHVTSHTVLLNANWLAGVTPHVVATSQTQGSDAGGLQPSAGRRESGECHETIECHSEEARADDKRRSLCPALDTAAQCPASSCW